MKRADALVLTSGKNPIFKEKNGNKKSLKLIKG